MVAAGNMSGHLDLVAERIGSGRAEVGRTAADHRPDRNLAVYAGTALLAASSVAGILSAIVAEDTSEDAVA